MPIAQPNYGLSTDVTLGGNYASDIISPSQKAIKAYVDGQVGVIVDQTYNPESANAQSGIAIAGAGFLTSITLADVTGALGFTPYDASNPEGFTSNIGTVTSINNINPDENGNVTITIPAAQVNADWDAVSGVAQILNKPTLATVATSGNYNDLTNKPTLATVATTGSYNDLSNTPTLATVATTGSYTDLSNTPTLATVATTGSYNDLTNKPTIPAAQVNADWEASSGVAEILNKPTLATVATTGSYSDLSNKPTLSDLADATQLSAINSGITTVSVAQISTNTSAISTINGKIPSQATTTNQLADKDFVNSSISTNTAYFDGTWDTYAAIPTVAAGFTSAGYPEPTNNNYLVVKADETQDGGTWRYKYVANSTTYSKNNWKVEYEVNETPLTADQLAALNSGATTTNIGQIATNTGNITSLQNNKQDASTAVTHTASTAVGSATRGVYVASNGAATLMTYELNKTVPSDAVFTDTKNTAGSTDTSSKIFLVGATSQTTSAQTYSQDTAFVDTNGRVNSAAPASDANDTTVATTKWVKDQSYSKTADTVTSVSAGSTANVISVTKNGSTSSITVNNVANATTATQATKLNLYRARDSVTNANNLIETSKVHVDELTTTTTNAPEAQWFHYYTSGSPDSNYGAQLALGMTSDNMYFRRYAAGTWGSWNRVAYTSQLEDYLLKSGGTMTGAITFANNTWNSMGDDASIGDHNVSGHICIKPNSSTYDNSGGISFHNSSGTALVQLNASSNTLTSSGALGISNNAAKMQYNSTTEAIEFVFA